MIIEDRALHFTWQYKEQITIRQGSPRIFNVATGLPEGEYSKGKIIGATGRLATLTPPSVLHVRGVTKDATDGSLIETSTPVGTHDERYISALYDWLVTRGYVMGA